MMLGDDEDLNNEVTMEGYEPGSEEDVGGDKDVKGICVED